MAVAITIVMLMSMLLRYSNQSEHSDVHVTVESLTFTGLRTALDARAAQQTLVKMNKHFLRDRKKKKTRKERERDKKEKKRGRDQDKENKRICLLSFITFTQWNIRIMK